MKLRPLFVSLCVVALPTVSAATGAWTGWWRHESTTDACVQGASAAFAVAQLTRINVNRQTNVISGFAGDYVASAICIDQTATLTIAGPNEAVTHSLYDRVKNAWR
jgi:O-glycosyl hydrolase